MFPLLFLLLKSHKFSNFALKYSKIHQNLISYTILSKIFRNFGSPPTKNTEVPINHQGAKFTTRITLSRT